MHIVRRKVSGGSDNVIPLNFYLQTYAQMRIIKKKDYRYMVMKLKELREKKGYTRRELSNKTGINLRSLQDYEQGHKSVTSMKSDTLFRLSLVLDCSMEDILISYYDDIDITVGSQERLLDEQMIRLLTYYKSFKDL